MEKYEFQEFFSILNKAAIIFDIEFSKERQYAYRDIFRGYSIDEFSAAMNQAVRVCKFFPKPAEILEFMGGNLSIQDEGTKEALVVIETMRNISAYETVKFENPITNAVVLQGFGGWQKMCNEMVEESNKWFIKDFVSIYRAYKGAKIESYSEMPGIAQSEGYQGEHNVILISDEMLRDRRTIKIE